MKSLGAMLIMLAAIGLAPPAPGPDDRVAIAAVLDALHQAASRAEGARYFSLFADDAVFFGTDASERWPIAEFERYATARFEQGRGWTYTVDERHVCVSEHGDVGWFDELLQNARYGTCRGTGVVVKRAGMWKIVRYNLSIPIPNEIALDVVEMIKTAGRGG